MDNENNKTTITQKVLFAFCFLAWMYIVGLVATSFDGLAVKVIDLFTPSEYAVGTLFKGVVITAFGIAFAIVMLISSMLYAKFDDFLFGNDEDDEDRT